VPGAIAGLEAAHKKYGRLSWHAVLAPAIKLAREGFPITLLDAEAINYRKTALSHNDYGMRTFFRNGKPVDTGDCSALARHGGQLGGYRPRWGEVFL
jgi:gamma-glutamyltranspeptidase/glutathione hydrolase